MPNCWCFSCLGEVFFFFFCYRFFFFCCFCLGVGVYVCLYVYFLHSLISTLNKNCKKSMKKKEENKKHPIVGSSKKKIIDCWIVFIAFPYIHMSACVCCVWKYVWVIEFLYCIFLLLYNIVIVFRFFFVLVVHFFSLNQNILLYSWQKFCICVFFLLYR